MPASVALAGKLGVPHFPSLETLFAQRAFLRSDGVALATPNHLHGPDTLLCVERGTPALIEKPVAGHHHEVCQRRFGRLHAVGHRGFTAQLGAVPGRGCRLSALRRGRLLLHCWHSEGSLAVPTLRTRTCDAGVAASGWWTPVREETQALDAVNPLQAQLDHFCDLIAGNAAPIITVADALQSVEAVRRSMATGQSVALRDMA
jgi:predicted dehydrogenase